MSSRTAPASGAGQLRQLYTLGRIQAQKGYSPALLVAAAVPTAGTRLLALRCACSARRSHLPRRMARLNSSCVSARRQPWAKGSTTSCEVRSCTVFHSLLSHLVDSVTRCHALLGIVFSPVFGAGSFRAKHMKSRVTSRDAFKCASEGHFRVRVNEWCKGVTRDIA